MIPGELARYGFSAERPGSGQPPPGQRAGHTTARQLLLGLTLRTMSKSQGGEAATAALCATSTCPGPGLRRDRNWSGWSVFQDRREAQRAFRRRLAETGSSTWAEVVAGCRGVASEEAARRQVTAPRAWSAATDLLLARRREGGRKRRPRQARAKEGGARLVSEETGRATTAKARRGASAS